MQSGFQVGQIFGIKIKIDWSLIIIFLLIVWNLSVSFGQMHDDWSTALALGLAIVAGILFFVSVLMHEISHALVARQRGIPIRKITLFLFGGIANIEREPASPKDEFLMAVIGPITSIVIGGFLVWLSGILIGTTGTVIDPYEVIQNLSPLATVVVWLGSINLVLGFFNLIPGFPLDGGRILRSALWQLTGSLKRATRWASWAGQGIAWIFIFAGVAMAFGARIPFFGTGLLSGLWLAFIGLFLNSAAVQSYQQTVIRGVLEDVSVNRLMKSGPTTVSPDLSIGQLVDDYVMQTDNYAFPVIDNAEFTGLVTLQDIRELPRDQWDDTTVREVMTPAADLVTADPDEDAAEALNKLSQRNINQLPVVRHRNELVGLLRRRDIVKWLQVQSDISLS